MLAKDSSSMSGCLFSGQSIDQNSYRKIIKLELAVKNTRLEKSHYMITRERERKCVRERMSWGEKRGGSENERGRVGREEKLELEKNV